MCVVAKQKNFVKAAVMKQISVLLDTINQIAMVNVPFALLVVKLVSHKKFVWRVLQTTVILEENMDFAILALLIA
jgi:hypothetical protein